jgi:translation initiation factor IF-2
MNISELARRLRVNPNELRDKLPELGFDIGKKAIKIDDRLAGRIIQAWNEYISKKREEQSYLKTKAKVEEAKAEGGAELKIPPVLTVKDLAQIMHLPVTIVIKQLIKNGVMASINQKIDFDTAAIIATDLGYQAVAETLDQKADQANDEKVKEILSRETDRAARPPVIVVMGHVDHGKTKLLDAIRKTDVVAGEAGGITQHIGAYQVEKQGRLLTFIDTPGHEAFTAMRSRGAAVADIAILVVAANDGVKPQTIEAQKIAAAAGIPIVVAINKVDLPDANLDKTKQELSQHNLLTEEWGGQTICVPISAKLNQNIDGLLDQVILVADLNADKIIANPNGQTFGTIIESHMDKGVGPVATVLIKNGTLRCGDQILIDGVYYGRIRGMRDHRGKEIKAAGPSMPAQISGLKVAAKIGDIIEVTEEKVKQVKAYRLEKKEETFVKPASEALDENNENIPVLNIVLRTDVLGSQEAIIEALEKIASSFVRIKFVQKGLGNIIEADVLTAESTSAMLLGFNVLPTPVATNLARDKAVVIRKYRIIYELLDAVKEELNKIIKPEIIREDLGQIQILKIFKKEPNFMIVGGKVTSGTIEKNVSAGVLRGGEFIEKGKITDLQVGKQIMTKVTKGEECGVRFVGRPLIEEGDTLDVYREREVKRFV